MPETLLVGAGPIGLELAAALKHHADDYLHIEAGNIASTIAWYAPGTQIFSSPDRLAIAGCPFMVYPGVRALREDYLAYLRTVVAHYHLDIRRYHRLVGAERTPRGFRCDIAHSARAVGGPEWNAADDAPIAMRVEVRRIILAVGNMHAPQLLNIPGEDSPWCSHYLGDIHHYAGCRVAIVGARNSAAEAAVRLARLGCAVTLCFRRQDLSERIKPWILPDLRTLVREGKVALVPRVTPAHVEPGRLHLKNLDDHRGIDVAADRILLLTGYVQSPHVFNILGVPLEPGSGRPIHDEETMETGVPGVYVAGTAAAGTQVSGVTHFIENSHVHVPRIMRSLGYITDAPAIDERPPELREE